MELLTLATYVQQLKEYLQWDLIPNVKGQEKQAFVEALTAIAALPLDSINMEIRRLLVVPTTVAQQTSMNAEAVTIHPPLHLRNIIAALHARDVLLKCKAASAVGSLYISRVAGQQLLDLYGHEILTSVIKMATKKNQWMQGDAFFVLGWIVVIADEAILMSIADLLPTVIRCLHRNIIELPFDKESIGDKKTSNAASRQIKRELTTSEKASNLRVYALVLLLNVSQRYVKVFDNELKRLLPMLKDLLMKLLEFMPLSVPEDKSATITVTIFVDASEYAETLRLTVTLLSVLADQLNGVGPQLLQLKMLPVMLKLQRVLDLPQVCEVIGEGGRQDIAGRLEAVIAVLLKHR